MNIHSAMHDMIEQSLNVLVLFGLFSSPLVGAAPATTSALGSQSGSQSSSNLICGKTGWDVSQESFLSTGYCNSWSYCQGVCELHSECKSFAYFNGASGDHGGDCELYSVPVQGNFVADSASNYKFYDKSCLTAEKQCNVKGYSRIDSFTGVKTDSISDCASTCSGYNQGSTGCVSYAFGNGDCQLYEYLVVDNVDVDSTSDYIFNDILCSQSASTTVTTTKSISKTTTTTTKVTSSTKTPSTTTTTKTTTTIKSSSTTKSTATAKASSVTTTSTTITSKVGSTSTTTKVPVPTTTTQTTATKNSSQTTATTTSATRGATTSSTAAQCGTLGWGRADPIFDFSAFTLSSCADFCYDYSGGSTNCRSYAFSPAAEECRLYNSTVADNVWASSDSDYGNYDLACRGATVSSTSTKITMTTTTLSGKTVTTTTSKTTSKSSQSVTTTTSSTKKSTTKSTVITTTTATTTTTTSDPAATTTAGPQCEVRGWGRGDPFFDYIGDTLQECAKGCFDNRGAPNYCQSYSYGFSEHHCKLYSNISVADNVYANDGADSRNYDLPCYNATLNVDPSICTPGYQGAQCNYKLNYDPDAGGIQILNSFDDCVISCHSITNCRHVVWYRQAAEGVPQNTCVLIRDPSVGGGVALNGVDSADRFY